MHIVLHSQTDDLTPWIEGLRVHLPQARFTQWRGHSDTHQSTEDADYALVWKPSQAFLDAHSQLKGVVNLGAGVDALLSLRINETVPIVRIVDGGMGVQMAEYAVFAVLQHYRSFKTYAEQQALATWRPLPVANKADYKVGVMGLGALGLQVVRALQYFEYPVLGWSASPKQIEGMQSFVGQEELGLFLSKCQAVVCLLPLTAQTRHILNSQTLAYLPHGAQLVNVARGGLVDEAALLAWLQADPQRSAFLDVVQEEPLPSDSPLWAHPQITLTPHIAAITLRDAATMRDVANSILSLERGERPVGFVLRERSY